MEPECCGTSGIHVVAILRQLATGSQAHNYTRQETFKTVANSHSLGPGNATARGSSKMRDFHRSCTLSLYTRYPPELSFSCRGQQMKSRKQCHMFHQKPEGTEQAEKPLQARGPGEVEIRLYGCAALLRKAAVCWGRCAAGVTSALWKVSSWFQSLP